MNKGHSLFLKLASQVGVKEIVGGKHNPIILDYFHKIGHKWVTTDEMAWCGAVVNWAAMESGCQMSNRLDAYSWLNIGQEVKNPVLGDVVVFWRGNYKGECIRGTSIMKCHVGLFVNEIEGKINTLGGNQNNEVNISPFPKERVLSYRNIS